MLCVLLVGDTSNFLNPEKPHESSVRCRNERRSEIVVNHVMHHLFDGDVRTHGARARAHDLLHGFVDSLRQFLGAKQSQDDSRLIDDDTRVPSRGGDALAYVRDAFVDHTRGCIPLSDVARPRQCRITAFGGKSCGHPVELAVDVVIDEGESKALEPPRGSRAQVSG
jgi:hypothetical protein